MRLKNLPAAGEHQSLQKQTLPELRTAELGSCQSVASHTSSAMDPLRGCPPLLQGLRILAEKVVHHPTIIAGHAEGRRWTLDADSDLRSKFWGRSIELMPVGAPLASDNVQK